MKPSLEASQDYVYNTIAIDSMGNKHRWVESNHDFEGLYRCDILPRHQSNPPYHSTTMRVAHAYLAVLFAIFPTVYCSGGKHRFAKLVLHDTRSAIPAGFTTSSPAKSTDILTFQIALMETDISGLNTALYSVSTPGSPSYGKYLTKTAVSDINSMTLTYLLCWSQILNRSMHTSRHLPTLRGWWIDGFP